MYGLYDKEGVLRFVNSDKDACLDYAELFEFNSTQFCLMNIYRGNNINPAVNQVENNN